jgi:hypothetical protein
MNITTQPDWVPSWRELEQSETNIGIDYVINPTLYPLIIESLAAMQSPTTIVDFGSGTSSLAFDLCIKQPRNVPGLCTVDPSIIRDARKNIKRYIGLESERRLVEDANQRFQKFTVSEEFNSMQIALPFDEPIPLFEQPTIAISRNFLMHLTIKEFDEHIKQAAEIVHRGGCYIFAVLNPEYEQNKEQAEFYNGELYQFHHGNKGELGIFSHYFKSDAVYKEILERYFVIEKKVSCLPISSAFSQSHPRYYNSQIPMAYVYIARAK